MIDGLSGALMALRGAFLALLVMPTGPADAGGRDVAVLVRPGVPVYGRFVERFEQTCDCSVRRVDLDEGADRAADAVRAMRPGAVVAVGRSALRMAAERLGDLPLLHALTLHPDTVLPATLAGMPGASLNADPARSLEVLRRLAPSVRRVAVIHDPRRTPVVDVVRAARSLGLEPDIRPVSDVSGALKAGAEALVTADAILLVPDRTALREEVLDHLLLQGLERRVPVVGFARKHVRRGALLALSATPEGVAVEVARLTERVLAGDSSPRAGRRRLHLSLNLRTAARLGLVVPEDVRRRADDLVR